MHCVVRHALELRDPSSSARTIPLHFWYPASAAEGDHPAYIHNTSRRSDVDGAHGLSARVAHSGGGSGSGRSDVRSATSTSSRPVRRQILPPAAKMRRLL